MFSPASTLLLVALTGCSHRPLALVEWVQCPDGQFWELASTTKPQPRDCSSIYLDIATARAVAPWSSAIDQISSLTVEAWIHPHGAFNASRPGALIVGHGTNSQSGYALSQDTHGVPIFTITSRDGMTSVVKASLPVAIGAWTHVAGQLDAGAAVLEIFVGGCSLGSTSVTNGGVGEAFGAPLVIGSEDPPPILTPRTFVGDIDEVRLSSGARYHSPFQPQRVFADDEQTLSLFHFDETGGSIARDSSRNSRDAVLSGGALFSVHPLGCP